MLSAVVFLPSNDTGTVRCYCRVFLCDRPISFFVTVTLVVSDDGNDDATEKWFCFRATPDEGRVVRALLPHRRLTPLITTNEVPLVTSTSEVTHARHHGHDASKTRHSARSN